MARKQNFSYQKFQRENAKAMKREAKKEQRARGPEPQADAPSDVDRVEADVDLSPSGPAAATEASE